MEQTLLAFITILALILAPAAWDFQRHLKGVQFQDKLETAKHRFWVIVVACLATAWIVARAWVWVTA